MIEKFLHSKIYIEIKENPRAALHLQEFLIKSSNVYMHNTYLVAMLLILWHATEDSQELIGNL